MCASWVAATVLPSDNCAGNATVTYAAMQTATVAAMIGGEVMTGGEVMIGG
jgi:hypothetical protein